MIKKTLFILTLGFSFQGQINARAVLPTDSIKQTHLLHQEEILKPLEPTLLPNEVAYSNWKSNWFFNVSGGTSAFIGSPLGCEDLFGRMKPTLAISAGKWFSPTVGSRVSFQGFQFKDSQSQTCDYQSLHGDLMWNITPHFYNARDRPRFDLIPYVGLGILHNESNGHHPFAFSYGVIGQYRLANKIHLTMELGGTTTFKDFDGRGASRELGDHLLGLTAGITFDIGKVGWKRVIDAKPYIVQNQWLIDYANALREKNHSRSKQHSLDANVIAQLKKIWEIEGLLGTYGDKLKNTSIDEENDGYPRNDYSGLNSLRARLANHGWNGQSTTHAASQQVNTPADSIAAGDYLSLMASGSKCIGSPIYFFFKIDTADLTESSQLLNLDELARVAKAYHLRVSVTGAADSATGTVPINNSLSASRADYIYNELVKRGVDGSRINKVSEGGIDDYKPTEANRHTKVCLYY